MSDADFAAARAGARQQQRGQVGHCDEQDEDEGVPNGCVRGVRSARGGGQGRDRQEPGPASAASRVRDPDPGVQ